MEKSAGNAVNRPGTLRFASRSVTANLDTLAGRCTPSPRLDSKLNLKPLVSKAGSRSAQVISQLAVERPTQFPRSIALYSVVPFNELWTSFIQMLFHDCPLSRRDLCNTQVCAARQCTDSQVLQRGLNK